MNRQYLPLIAAIALALGLWAAMTYSPVEPIAVANASRMPPLPLVSLDGKIQGDWQPKLRTVTVVNFFASWCAPCLAEYPELKKLAAIKGVEIHGIAWNDSEENLKNWVAKHGNAFTRIWRDTTGQAAITAGIRGVPESYVVDKTGKVRLHIRGAIGPEQTEQLKKMLVEMRDAPAS